MSLSDKIEIVGFYSEVKFKDKEGNIKMFPANKGEEGLKVKGVKEAVKEVKNAIKKHDWQDMAHYVDLYDDLDRLLIKIDKIFGDKLVEKQK